LRLGEPLLVTEITTNFPAQYMDKSYIIFGFGYGYVYTPQDDYIWVVCDKGRFQSKGVRVPKLWRFPVPNDGWVAMDEFTRNPQQLLKDEPYIIKDYEAFILRETRQNVRVTEATKITSLGTSKGYQCDLDRLVTPEPIVSTNVVPNKAARHLLQGNDYAEYLAAWLFQGAALGGIAGFVGSGIFVAQRRKKLQEKVRQEAENESLLRKKDVERQRRLHVVERWTAGLGDVSKAESFYERFIVPVENGTTDLDILTDFLAILPDKHIAAKADDFSVLVLRILREGVRQIKHPRSWCILEPLQFYSFQYPVTLRLEESNIDVRAANKESADAWFFHLLLAMQALGKNEASEAKSILLDAAQKAMPFELSFFICLQCGWLENLEKVCREKARFTETLKLLLCQNKWEAVLEWLKKHHKFCECVFALEKMGRFSQAVEKLEQLGPVNYEEYQPDGKPIAWDAKTRKEAFDQKLAKLKSFAAVAEGRDNSPVIPPEELERMRAYGEITEEEYAAIKAKSTHTGKVCPACNTPIQFGFSFCPRCGGKI